MPGAVRVTPEAVIVIGSRVVVLTGNVMTVVTRVGSGVKVTTLPGMVTNIVVIGGSVMVLGS